MDNHLAIGKTAEELACEFLLQQGLQLKEANYQCKQGEVDLVMQDGEVVVFIEVRHRQVNDYGDGAASVGRSKQRRIVKAATYYLQEHNLYDKVACRFDVVSSSGAVGAKMHWIKDAFWAKWG